MGIEIERKFLVQDDAWREIGTCVCCKQGYLAVGPPVAVRVRIMGDQATLNIKKSTLDIVRSEFEYPIPIEDAEALLESHCEGFSIDKTRHKVPFGGAIWEIDEFHGHNKGLIVAEIELERADQDFARPPWLGQEVSHDPRYLNSSLSRLPFTQWT